MNCVKFLSVLTIIAAPSVASASAKPVADTSYMGLAESTYLSCQDKGALHLALASSAGYTDAYDLAGIWVETYAGCLREAGLSAANAKPEAEYYYCDIVANLKASVSDPNGHGAYDVCEDALAERLAERAQ